MFWWRSVREYLLAVLRAYQSFVLGLVFGVAGAIGLFVADESGVRIAALIGVALGFLVAPYKAYQRVRWERDIARSESPIDHLGLRLGFVNALSGGNWGIDNLEPPNIAGLVARGITATQHPLAHGAEISSVDMDRFRDAVARSPIAVWLAERFPSEDERNSWKLTEPCNGFEFTVVRGPVACDGGGSEVSARCMLLLPRGIWGNAPRLMVDVYFRDLPRDVPEAGQPDQYSRFDLAGDPYRPNLPELVSVLDALADTLTEVAPVALKPFVHRTWRERLRERSRRELTLVGPNLHVRSRPRPLWEAIRLPDLPRLGAGGDQAELMVQTPPTISAYDRVGRMSLIRRELRRLLRTLQYRDFEDYVEQLRASTAESNASLPSAEPMSSSPREGTR